MVSRAVGWGLKSFGVPGCVGIKGTGSYGAGLARHLTAEGVSVVDVNRELPTYLGVIVDGETIT